MAEIGRYVPLGDILAQQNRRDLEDRMRPIGRLRPAPDAIILQSDGLLPDDVLLEVLRIVHQARGELATLSP